MSVQSNSVLKSYFNTGDKPTEAQFTNLIDTITSNNLRTVAYTVGVAGVTGCNHNFTSVANTTEQSIQLGGTTIIPANSRVLQITAKCVTGLNGVITGTTDIGITSGSTTYIAAGDLDDTDELIFAMAGSIPGATTFSVATSIYFSFTPSANWDTITTGKWKIYITYIDNSTL